MKVSPSVSINIITEKAVNIMARGWTLFVLLKEEYSEYTYPDSLLLGGSGRVVGTQALRVIAVTALIAL